MYMGTRIIVPSVSSAICPHFESFSSLCPAENVVCTGLRALSSAALTLPCSQSKSSCDPARLPFLQA